jgi:hypothetical protein
MPNGRRTASKLLTMELTSTAVEIAREARATIVPP